MAPRLEPETLNVAADAPDLRDRYYRPTLRALQRTWHPPGNLHIQDQGVEGACTGFGLAAVINLLYRQRDAEQRVSPRMLYEMARRYDEWAGEDYDWSSCRGAIKGWMNSGVCTEALCPYHPEDRGFRITPEISREAREHTVGAYYRLRPVVSDFHAAINEAGVIYTSAHVHDGWREPRRNRQGETVIRSRERIEGGHAFAIVGYNDLGFWIQNSWGDDWGDGGLAIWTYEDWAANVMDAWVVQLALPTPQIFDLRLNAGRSAEANRSAISSSPPRLSIEEHFVHLDDGRYCDSGRYWSNREHMAVVQSGIRRSDCRHLLLYAHGGLNSVKDSARRIAAMKPVFLDNGIYPFHFMYDTGLLEELKDVIAGKGRDAEAVSGSARDWVDRRLEDLTRKPGRALWREMKRGAQDPFHRVGDDGSDVLERLLAAVDELPEPTEIHLAGHSTGAILQAWLLERLARQRPDLRVASCSLLAPAASVALFERIYRPLLDAGTVSEMTVYNLSDELEQDDSVAGVYGKSLLYLVSRAFEEQPLEPLLGMQIHNDLEPPPGPTLSFVYSRGKRRGRSRSTSHGGFDNDPATMNDLLRRVLGRGPRRAFTAEDLDY